MTALETAFIVFDYAAVAVFAATGALAAARQKHDIVTFAFFAAITGVGGGTLRDLLIDAPVFWISSPGYLIACIAAAVAVWLVGERTWRMGALLWLDAIGMAAYAVVGAAKALSLGLGPIPATVMGVLTACFGREIYVTAALLAATVFVGLASLGVDRLVAGGAGFTAGLALRGAALRWGWSLPAFGKGSGTPS
jgi:uncharacterized membrane protein YeiH